MSVCFCVGLDHFGFVELDSFVALVPFQYRVEKLAGKNVSEMTYFCRVGRVKTCSFHPCNVLSSCNVSQ